MRELLSRAADVHEALAARGLDGDWTLTARRGEAAMTVPVDDGMGGDVWAEALLRVPSSGSVTLAAFVGDEQAWKGRWDPGSGRAWPAFLAEAADGIAGSVERLMGLDA